VRPAYDVLHRAVTRFVYGDQRDPVRAIGRLGRELTQERGEDTVLHRVARSVVEALRVPYVVVREADRGTVASYGTAIGDARLHEVPLRYAGRSVGALLVSRRTPGAGLSAADRALLELVAGPDDEERVQPGQPDRLDGQEVAREVPVARGAAELRPVWVAAARCPSTVVATQEGGRRVAETRTRSLRHSPTVRRYPRRDSP
jgi:hypothetical protein